MMPAHRSSRSNDHSQVYCAFPRPPFRIAFRHSPEAETEGFRFLLVPGEIYLRQSPSRTLIDSSAAVEPGRLSLFIDSPCDPVDRK